MGVGGGVNPSPKGKKGVGKGNSLDHLRPKGLVGFWAPERPRTQGICGPGVLGLRLARLGAHNGGRRIWILGMRLGMASGI